MTEKTCAFCALPGERIFLSNLHGVVIRDAFPVSHRRTLVIPGRHVGSFFETEPAERDALLSLLDEAKRRLDREMKTDGHKTAMAL
jgi:diadenosine tetraphosphate (Ap4A) HIT family hydrolase